MALQYFSGSEAIAQAVKLCRVEVMSAYPITPNTPTLAAISDLIRDGEMDMTSVNAESELGAMMIVNGAASVGVRTFNCSASQGLALMKEPLWRPPEWLCPWCWRHLPSVGRPQGLVSDFSDCFSERDASFVQYVCENNQEIVDNTIIAYKVGEDPRILLPAFVVYEGFRSPIPLNSWNCRTRRWWTVPSEIRAQTRVHRQGLPYHSRFGCLFTILWCKISAV